ncbi:MAG TPA: hydroxysqualene dehydroxylase HpnE [Solirubrobacteraceae bacterium]|nr:hydroxysqualene dehydroxylase HpnE [Solirubrobacteraceae bacterium]
MTGRVVIVGGGLAGITAALDCADAGCDVTLLEVRPRLGGAAYSFDRDGLRIDNGQHVFLRCCVEYLGLLDRLGSRSLTTLQPKLALPVVAPGGRVAWLRRSGLPAPLHLAGALAGYHHLGPFERARVAPAAAALSRLDPDDRDIDARTFGDWLAERHQSVRAIECFWDLIARPTLNLPAAEASLALAAYVFQTGLLSDAAAGDIGWARAPLSDVHDVPAQRALAAAGAEVRLGWRATQVRPDGERGWTVEGSDDRVSADAVIVAVPHGRLDALLPPGALAGVERLEMLGTSPIVNLHVVYDRRVMDFDFAAAVGSPVQWVFDRTRGAGVESGQYLAVSLSAAEEEMGMSVEGLRSRYLPALAQLFPRARQAQVIRFLVSREHAATFRGSPGVASRRPSARTRLNGLTLAGSFTDTGWPATMEGAVRSGHTAAREALATLDQVHPALAA